jgi:Plasmid pRiA4b ORF-3-like protein
MAATKKSTKRREKPEFVHQFLVVLTGTDPLVWRRIQVPQGYSFWDLHVAIQDAMGWKDYHLHEFRLFDEAAQTLVSIGIPTGEEAEDRPAIAGWDVPVSRFFSQQGWHEPPVTYAYDFGDDWQHVMVHEGFEPADDSLTYPRCIAGEGRCPPEDCGGVHGYAAFLAAIADPDHEEHEQMVTWAGGEFDPEMFDPAAVTFDDPRRRWKNAFGRGR